VPVRAPRIVATADAELIAAPVGRYRLQGGLGVDLPHKGDALTIQANDQPEFEMGYDSASRFLSAPVRRAVSVALPGRRAAAAEAPRRDQAERRFWPRNALRGGLRIRAGSPSTDRRRGPCAHILQETEPRRAVSQRAGHNPSRRSQLQRPGMAKGGGEATA
jgi:hypothetical protein